MRTLKKVLALTVVLATLLSISAFAAFSDEESIDESFVDAVNLLGALNVMTGDTEGTFRPNDTISRAEAAKMIYVIRNGGVDDQAAGWTGMSTFSDVASGVWFEGYVNYCASLGIIAGVGGGKFNPSGAVTGVELAKMLLVVADYKPDIEGYTGAGWNLNVIRDAQTVGMFEGYTLAYSAAATRQQAAQLFSNAILETEMAVYIGDTRVNDLSMVGSSDTIGGRFFDLEIATGVLEQVPYVTLNATGEADLDVNNDEAVVDVTSTTATTTAGALTGDSNFVFAVEPELLYQEVDVVYKESGNRDGLDDKDTVYSVYATGTSTVYETTMDAVTLDVTNADDASAEHKLTVKFDGYNGGRARTYTNDSSGARTIPVFTNYYLGKTVAASTSVNEDGEYYVVNSAFLSNDSTAPVRMVDSDSDGFIDAAFVTATLYGEVANYNPDRNDFETGIEFGDLEIDTNRDEDEFALYTFEDDLVEGDIVAVTVDVLSGEEHYTVSLVEPVVGELTRITADSETMVVGGTTYSFFGMTFDGVYGVARNTTLDDVTIADYGTSDLGEELYLYVDGTYIFAATDGTGNSVGGNFGYVQDIRLGADSANQMKTDVIKVQLTTADGVTDVYDYYDRGDDATEYVRAADIGEDADENGTWETDNTDNFIGELVEYRINGTNITFYKTPTAYDKVAEGDVGYGGNYSAVAYNSDKGTFGNALRVSDSSVFFVVNDDDEVEVFTGAELKGEPTISNDVVYNTTSGYTASDDMHVVWSKPTNGLQTIAFAVLDDYSDLSEGGTFALTTSNLSQDGTGSSAVDVMTLIMSDDEEGTANEVTVDGSSLARRKLYTVSVDSNNVHTLDKVTLTNAVPTGDDEVIIGSVSAVDGNAVQIDGTIYTVTDDTIILSVDTTNWVYDITSSITRAEDGAENIIFTADEKGNLINVWIEEDGLTLRSLVNYADTDEVELTVDAVNVGDDTVTINPEAGALYSIAVEQYEDNDFSAAGNTVNATVTVTPTAGTSFASSVTVTVNGGTAATPVKPENDGTLVIEVSATVVDTIDDLSKLTLAAPTNGAELPDAIADTGAEFTVASTTWKENDAEGSAATGNAAGGTTYYVEVVLNPKANYSFDADLDDTTLTGVTGFTAPAVTVNEDGTVTVIATVEVALESIESLPEITLAAPANNTGSLSDEATFSTTAGIVDGPVSVTWTKGGSPIDTTATGSGEYVATFTLVADEGYVFDDSLVGSVTNAGITDFDTVTATKSGNDLVITATKTFA